MDRPLFLKYMSRLSRLFPEEKNLRYWQQLNYLLLLLLLLFADKECMWLSRIGRGLEVILMSKTKMLMAQYY